MSFSVCVCVYVCASCGYSLKRVNVRSLILLPLLPQGDPNIAADFRLQESQDGSVSFESVTCPGAHIGIQSKGALQTNLHVFLVVGTCMCVCAWQIFLEDLHHIPARGGRESVLHQKLVESVQ